jgi:hypothetical protein
VSRAVGLALSGLGLAYLAFWWRSHAAGATAPAQLAVLLLGIGFTTVLARFGSLAAVAVLSSGTAGPLPAARLSRRHTVPIVAAAGVLLACGLAVTRYLDEAAPARPPDFAVVPTGLRVRVLAVDGLDARMVEALLARGKLPALARLRKEGAWGRMAAEPEQVPAIVWTTIATGRGPEAHGITGTGARRLAGMATPVGLGGEGRLGRTLARATDLLRLSRATPPSAVLRSAKAFWNVASDKGLRVGVVNWWATWPADPVNGYLVSDRAFLRRERGGGWDREAQPAAVLAALGRVPLPEGTSRAEQIDAFHSTLARRLRESEPPVDVEALYLPGLDILATQLFGEATSPDLAGMEARLGAVRELHARVDQVLAGWLHSRPHDEVVVLVGDPGRLARRDGGRPEGVVALAGGPVRPTDLGSVSARDVAPTILHLVGLPRSDELDGRVLEQAWAAEFRSRHPVRAVASYGRRPPAGPAESGFDRDVLEELRSLGYIQ